MSKDPRVAQVEMDLPTVEMVMRLAEYGTKQLNGYMTPTEYGIITRLTERLNDIRYSLATAEK